MKPKRAAVIAGILCALYVASYVPLTLLGGNVSPNASARPGEASEYLAVWQPKFVVRIHYLSVLGDDHTRSNLLGTMYAPLIELDWAVWHRPLDAERLGKEVLAPMIEALKKAQEYAHGSG